MWTALKFILAVVVGLILGVFGAIVMLVFFPIWIIATFMTGQWPEHPEHQVEP